MNFLKLMIWTDFQKFRDKRKVADSELTIQMRDDKPSSQDWQRKLKLIAL